MAKLILHFVNGKEFEIDFKNNIEGLENKLDKIMNSQFKMLTHVIDHPQAVINWSHVVLVERKD